MNLRFQLLFPGAILFFAIWSCSNNGNTKLPEKPGFNEHIAPLILKNCAPCHHENGMAPFPLENYQQVKKKAKTIVKVTSKRIMPPWPADPAYTHFAGEKYLSNDEIALIEKWYKTGMSEGTATAAVKSNLMSYRSSLGKPDMVLPLDSVLLFPNLRDRFFIIKIPGHLKKDTWVKAVEFVAGTPDLVHHFNGHLLMFDKGKKKQHDAFPLKVEITAGEYDQDFSRLNLLHDDGSKPFRQHSVVNYLPGVLPVAYPDGIGTFRLSGQFVFVGNDLHYGPSDRLVTDRSFINLFFTDKPPSRPTGELMLGTNGVSKIEPPLIIPAGKKTRHKTEFLVNADISVLTVNPHLHLLGKSFLAYAIKPNGDTIRLIRIPQWDFRWQYFYTFRNPVHIPAGSTIVAWAEFDNTSGNPNNPFQPPREVGERLEFGGASMRATDEMFQFIITFMDYKKGDELIQLDK